MKKSLHRILSAFIVLSLCATVMAYSTAGEALHTIKSDWVVVGTAFSPTSQGTTGYSGNMASPTYLQMDYNSIIGFSNTAQFSNTIVAVRPAWFNACLFRFSASTVGGNNGFNVYASWGENDFQKICSLSLTTGLQEANVSLTLDDEPFYTFLSASMVNYYTGTCSNTTPFSSNFSPTYCDGLTISNENWPTTMKAVSPGGNGVALLGLDTCGAESFVFVPSSLTVATSETIIVEMTGY